MTWRERHERNMAEWPEYRAAWERWEPRFNKMSACFNWRNPVAVFVRPAILTLMEWYWDWLDRAAKLWQRLCSVVRNL